MGALRRVLLPVRSATKTCHAPVPSLGTSAVSAALEEKARLLPSGLHAAKEEDPSTPPGRGAVRRVLAPVVASTTNKSEPLPPSVSSGVREAWDWMTSFVPSGLHEVGEKKPSAPPGMDGVRSVLAPVVVSTNTSQLPPSVSSAVRAEVE